MNKYETMVEFLSDLDENRRDQVEALRKLILTTDPSLVEGIKWNSPSYTYNGEDRITFNLHHKDQVRLLFHMGATRKEDRKGTPVLDDTTGLIEWNSDIRGTVSFTSLDDIKRKEANLVKIVKQWLLLP